MKTTIILSASLLFSAFSFAQSTSATAQAGVATNTAVSAQKATSASAATAASVHSETKASAEEAKSIAQSQKQQAAATATTTAKAENKAEAKMITTAGTPASTNVRIEKDNNIGLNTSINGHSGQSASVKSSPSAATTRMTASSSATVRPVHVYTQAVTGAAVRIR